MNWLKKGPELKLPKLKKPSLKRGDTSGEGAKGPSIKPPAFLADLYYDMRDRRLLPIIALVLVAIVAVPFLMGSDPEPLPPVSEGASPEVTTARASQLTVVEATPGLRDYRKRLRGRSATDPFVQQYTESAGGGGSEGGSSSSSRSSSAESAPVETGGAGDDGGETALAPTPAPNGSGSGGDVPPTTGRLFAYRPNVRFGVAGSESLAVHEHLPLGSLLPKKNPIAVFIGSSENGKRVAFNLSRDVIDVRGPGSCAGGKEDCSLLFLRAGQAVDLVTEAGQTFRLHVVQIDFVEVEKPSPAPAESSAVGKRRSSFESLVVGQFQK